MPEFWDENDNVRRRIQVFETSSLPNIISGIDSWIYDHAMDCVAWAAQEIENHHDFVSKEELWYESDVTSVVTSQSGEALWKCNEVRNITMADLEPLNPSNVAQVSQDTIYPGFIAELHSTDKDKTIPSSHIVFPTDSSDTNGGRLTPKNNILSEEEVQVGAGEFNEIASSLDGNDDAPQQGYEEQNGSQQANSSVEVE